MKTCINKKKVLLLQHFSINNKLFNTIQIMVGSQTFNQKNGNKYRAKVEFTRVYDTEQHIWLNYYSHEKNCDLKTFLNSIAGLITQTLATCLNTMAYSLYQFYYLSDNIKIRKYGDQITIYYGDKNRK